MSAPPITKYALEKNTQKNYVKIIAVFAFGRANE